MNISHNSTLSYYALVLKVEIITAKKDDTIMFCKIFLFGGGHVLHWF